MIAILPDPMIDWELVAQPLDADRPEHVPGAGYQTMHGVGPFPMREGPERFRGYLLPGLDAIRAKGA